MACYMYEVSCNVVIPFINENRHIVLIPQTTFAGRMRHVGYT